MNIKANKCISFIILILFVITFYINISLSFNFHEFEHCQDEHCSLCMFIQQASNCIKMLSIILMLYLFNSINKITEKLKNKVVNCMSNTPINNKVQFNE